MHRGFVYILLKALKQMFEIIGLPHAVLTVLPICYGMHCKYWSKYWPWVMIFNNWVLFWMCDIAGYIYWERRLHITNVWLNKQRLNWLDWFRLCKLETFVLGKSAQATCLAAKNLESCVWPHRICYAKVVVILNFGPRKTSNNLRSKCPQDDRQGETSLQRQDKWK